MAQALSPFSVHVCTHLRARARGLSFLLVPARLALLLPSQTVAPKCGFRTPTQNLLSPIFLVWFDFSTVKWVMRIIKALLLAFSRSPSGVVEPQQSASQNLGEITTSYTYILLLGFGRIGVLLTRCLRIHSLEGTLLS